RARLLVVSLCSSTCKSSDQNTFCRETYRRPPSCGTSCVLCETDRSLWKPLMLSPMDPTQLKLRLSVSASTALGGPRGLALDSAFPSSPVLSAWTDLRSPSSQPKATTRRISRKARSGGCPTSNSGFGDILPTGLSCVINTGPAFFLPRRLRLPSQIVSPRKQGLPRAP